MILANTFPKSGTGLLRQVLEPFGPDGGHISMFNGSTGKRVKTLALVELAEHISDTDGYITAHLHWSAQLADALGDTPVIMLVRDPRDVILSHAKYIYHTDTHHLHKYCMDNKFNISLIILSMLGIPDLPGGQEFPDIGRRFTPYLGWMDNAYVVHFEDLIQDSINTTNALAAHLGDVTQAPLMREAIDPSRSLTFRKGRVGGWEEEFSDAEKECFNKRFSWLLPLMGYGAKE